MIILINAGHGGWNLDTKEYLTPPTTGKKTLHTNGNEYHDKGWFYEGVFNRIMAAELIAKITLSGLMCVPVYMPNKDMPLNDIPKAANEIQEILNKYYNEDCIFLSIHANSASSNTSPQNLAGGVCSFVYSVKSETAAFAYRINKKLQDLFDRYGSKRRSGLVNDSPLTVTKYTKMPAILLELGFFDNPQNADLLMLPTFRAEIAEIIAAELVEKYGRAW